jgi:prolyl-tRNA synthetase
MLVTIQAAMLERATAFRDSHIHHPKITKNCKRSSKTAGHSPGGAASKACEAKVKEDTKATTRCIPLEQPGGTGKCIVCGQEAEKKVYFARAY